MPASCWGTLIAKTGQEDLLGRVAESCLARTTTLPCPKAFQSILEVTSTDASRQADIGRVTRAQELEVFTVRPEPGASHELLEELLSSNLEQAVITQNI